MKHLWISVCGNSSVVEHNLAKVGVASSNLVSRSINETQNDSFAFFLCLFFFLLIET